MGPVVWDVIGSELLLREHVARQAGVTRVTGHGPRGTWTITRGARQISACMALMIK